MQFVYVLTGEKEDYALMAEASILSLRRHNPTAKIVLLCWPREIEGAGVAARKRVFELCDQVCFPELPEGINSREASRNFKTRMRHLVEGDYFYLDTDTLVMRSLDRLPKGHDVMMTPDRYKIAPWPLVHEWAKEMYVRQAWPIPRAYYNAGVIFVRDTAETHALSDLWYKWWQKGLIEEGEYRDQLSLNAAIAASRRGLVGAMSTSYNAMIDADVRMARRAHIIHFYASIKLNYGPTLLDHDMENLRQGRPIDLELHERARKTGWPFISARPSEYALVKDYTRRVIDQFYMRYKPRVRKWIKG